ncbi:MAG: hypothetical protein AAF170_03205 [Bacteroidota bacterium]
MTTIQIDDQVFAVLQRAGALLFEPSPNKVLRRMLLSDPILASLPDAPWPSVTTLLLDDEVIERKAAASKQNPLPDLESAPKAIPDPTSSTTTPGRIPHPTIPPPRFERAPEPPPRLPTWQSLGEVMTPRQPSVASHSGSLPPGLRQALDVVHLIVRHRVPRPEAIRRVDDLRRAAGAPTDGPRLKIGAKEFDRMIRQRGRTDLRAVLKETFPGYDDTIDSFFDELSASRRKKAAST